MDVSKRREERIGEDNTKGGMYTSIYIYLYIFIECIYKPAEASSNKDNPLSKLSYSSTEIKE